MYDLTYQNAQVLAEQATARETRDSYAYGPLARESNTKDGAVYLYDGRGNVSEITQNGQVTAALLHIIPQTIVFTFFYFLVRTIIGGWHAPTPLLCGVAGFFYWLLWVGAAQWLLDRNPNAAAARLIVLIVQGLIVCVVVPLHYLKDSGRDATTDPRFAKRMKVAVPLLVVAAIVAQWTSAVQMPAFVLGFNGFNGVIAAYCMWWLDKLIKNKKMADDR